MAVKLTFSLGRFFLTTLVLALLAGCGRNESAAKANKPPAPKVKLASVESGTIDKREDYIANLESRRSVELKPQVEGKVTRILVRAGDRVAQGTEIIQVDPAKQQASVSSFTAAAESARAEMQNARATLASLEAQRLSKVADLKFNQDQYKSYAKLFAQGAIAQQNLNQYRNSLQSAEASLGSINAQIQAQQAAIAQKEKDLLKAQANTKQEQVQLQYFRISAPFSGTIGNIPVKVGDFVNTSTQLAILTDNQQIEVRFSVPSEKAQSLRLEMPVEVINEQGKSVGTSRIFLISPNGTTETDSVGIVGNVLVKSLFDNSQGQLRAGEKARVQIVSDKRPGVLIPATAVARIAGQSFVFVAQPPEQNQQEQPQQGKSQQGQAQAEQPKLVAKQKPVKLGDIRGNNYQVLEGLQPGEKIVTSGILNLTDGVPINPES